MSNLFNELKRIGIDEKTAHHVAMSVNPDYLATKQDIQVMQETIMQVQLKTEQAFKRLDNKIDKVDAKVDKVEAGLTKEIAAVRTEMHGLSRQYWITFGGLITTIVTVFLTNWYYHSIG